MESKDDPEGGLYCPTLDGVREVNKRIEALREPLSAEKTEMVTDLVKGSITVEVPGRFDPETQDSATEPMTLPEPRLLSEKAPPRAYMNVTS